eukprot:scaffold9753_cov73-Cylindrotheca_fusiformis.AAC.2
MERVMFRATTFSALVLVVVVAVVGTSEHQVSSETRVVAPDSNTSADMVSRLLLLKKYATHTRYQCQ